MGIQYSRRHLHTQPLQQTVEGFILLNLGMILLNLEHAIYLSFHKSLYTVMCTSLTRTLRVMFVTVNSFYGQHHVVIQQKKYFRYYICESIYFCLTSPNTRMQKCIHTVKAFYNVVLCKQKTSKNIIMYIMIFFVCELSLPYREKLLILSKRLTVYTTNMQLLVGHVSIYVHIHTHALHVNGKVERSLNDFT